MFSNNQALVLSLPDGQHTGLRCAACGSTDKSLSANVSGGTAQWICHRASCGDRGRVGFHSHPNPAVHHRTSRVRPQSDMVYPLPDADREFFINTYHIEPVNFKITEKQRYLIPILSPTGRVRGHIARLPYVGSPLREKMAYTDSNAPKALTYMITDEPVMSWHRGERAFSVGQSPPVVLVEDSLSAMRLAQCAGFTAVALMGTGLNEEKIAELQQQHVANVVMALDADATGQAFAHARKWGSAFKKFNVLVLTKDIKNASPNELLFIHGRISNFM